jgi:transposase
MLYQDELTVYRQPTQGWLWAHMGRCQPKMKYTSKYNTSMRLVGYLNAITGAVHCEDMKSVTADRLIKNLRKIPYLYPDAECIYIVWDNWQNHRLPVVLEALDGLPRVEVLCLPTYSPWLNPIEKLWRWLYQTVIHAHQWSQDFLCFRTKIMSALKEHAGGSEALLQYVGLSM